jgi:AcrR family transcriptional regulator
MARKSVQEERKLQILKALDTCLQNKSFEKTSIKDIARTAGVNHGVLHYYFESKEDILLNYIDYVIDDYQTQVQEWLKNKNLDGYGKNKFIQEIFEFVNHRITLNKGLSHIFVEIWEISLYHEVVRRKLRVAYRKWIDVLSGLIRQHMKDQAFSFEISTAMVAFWEGMALFSIIFGREGLHIEEVLDIFQQKILKIL